MNIIQKNLTLLKQSSRELLTVSPSTIDTVLGEVADELVRSTNAILEANAKDLAKLSPIVAEYDRLKLSRERIADMAEGLRALIKIKSPVGEIIDRTTRPNGLDVCRIRVPLGVVGIIYEARPNVTTDAFGITFKTHNAVALKGSSFAHESNKILVDLIQKQLEKHKISKDIIYLLPAPRSASENLMKASSLVDVIIPRGGQNLINYVRSNSIVPVIETGAGVVHTYFDETGDLNIGQKVIMSAKTRRPSVCNALDTLIINSKRLADLPELVAKLSDESVTIYADAQAYSALLGIYPKNLLKKATKNNFGVEYLDLVMSIKTVSNLDEALNHIAHYSSRHSEAIISEDKANVERFLNEVDAACIFHNTETGFSDGGELGLGAEIGISTQKLHARGPMGLAEITSYKWVIRGNGQTRLVIK